MLGQGMQSLYSIALCFILDKNTVYKERNMIRIVCPHCHSPLSTVELEQATIAGHLSLICPECSSVLVSEPAEPSESHTLEEHFANRPVAHA